MATSTNQYRLEDLAGKVSSIKEAPLDAIQRWELPSQKPLEQPRPIEVGGTVQLRGTCQTYRVLQLYPVYCGQGEYQDWAELRTHDGKPAHWKVQQLEVMR